MTVDNKRIKQHDDKIINITAPYAIRNWCSLFEISREELISAINTVGTKAGDVRKYLQK